MNNPGFDMATGFEKSPVYSLRRRKRERRNRIFRIVCLGSTMLGVFFLLTVMVAVLFRVIFPANDTRETMVSASQRLQQLADFFGRLLNNGPGIDPTEVGYKVGLAGTLWLLFFVVLLAVPVAVGAAVFLEEYCNDGKIRSIIQTNISNLAGVPSIVYGLLGLAIFQRGFGYSRLALGPCLLAGALTLSLLILPVILIATQEALRAIPKSMRYAALALGATRWQLIRDHLLPAAMPGILTGSILGISRAIGETAPLLMVGAAASLLKPPKGPFSRYTALPVEIYFNAKEPDPAYSTVAAGGILILLALLLCLNFSAITIRNRHSAKHSPKQARPANNI